MHSARKNPVVELLNVLREDTPQARVVFFKFMFLLEEKFKNSAEMNAKNSKKGLKQDVKKWLSESDINDADIELLKLMFTENTMPWSEHNVLINADKNVPVLNEFHKLAGVDLITKEASSLKNLQREVSKKDHSIGETLKKLLSLNNDDVAAASREIVLSSFVQLFQPSLQQTKKMLDMIYEMRLGVSTSREYILRNSVEFELEKVINELPDAQDELKKLTQYLCDESIKSELEERNISNTNIHSFITLAVGILDKKSALKI